MLPLIDENPTRRFPVLTVLLIVVNVAIFVFQLQRPEGPSGVGSTNGVFYAAANSQEGLACSYGLVPDRLLHGDRSIEPAQLPDGRVIPACEELNERHPRFLALFTSLFIHGGWLHLLGNMLFLWVFGNNVEDRLGRVRFLPFYVLCGIAAGFLQSAVSPSDATPLIGASGAISGVLAAYLVLYPRARVWTLVFFIPLRLAAWFVIIAWFLFQFLYAAGQTQGGSGVAYWAHVGGFLAGLALIKPFLVGRPPSRPPPRPVTIP